MRKKIHIIALSSLTLIVLFTFNNCGNYADSSLISSSNNIDESCVIGRDCKFENTNALELRINSDSNFSIGAEDNKFNVGGDCNEGGFPFNVIFWELKVNGTLIADSQSNYNTTCVNGRFNAFVKLPHAGLSYNDVRQIHTLEIEIWGYDTASVVQKNSSMARKLINLVPL